MIIDENTHDDFGFTFTNEPQPHVMGVAHENKITRIMELITPFLNNLKTSPEKTMIKWPDRAAKVAAFQAKLEAIAKE